jgi:hypothetical protein
MGSASRRLQLAATLLFAALSPALIAAEGPPVRIGWDPPSPSLHLPTQARGDPLPGWSITPKLLAGAPLGRGQGAMGGGLSIGGRLPFLDRGLFLEVELQGTTGSSAQTLSITQGGASAGTVQTQLSRKQGSLLLSLQRRYDDLLANYLSLLVACGGGVIASSNRLTTSGVTDTSSELRPAGHLSLAVELANLGPGSPQLETRLQLRGDAPFSQQGAVSVELAFLLGYRLWFR